MLTFGSLFAGIGGLDLGLERAGMRCLWQVEIDEFCRRVLAKHWPDVPKHGDIRELSGDELQRVDLICGGFPCQDISNAGKRAGIGGERSGLWSEYIRLVRVLRPRFVLVENVAALLGRGIGTVLGDLAASGYDAEWDCLPAVAVGAPHIRDRIFVVAYVDSERELQSEGAVCQERRRISDGGTPVAYAPGARRDEGLCASGGSLWHEARRAESERLGSALANPDRQGLAVGEVFGGDARAELASFERSCCTLSDTDGESLGRTTVAWPERGIWAVEPPVGRVVDGIPGRMDRIRGLGNAVVPQVAEYIGRRIVALA